MEAAANFFFPLSPLLLQYVQVGRGKKKREAMSPFSDSISCDCRKKERDLVVYLERPASSCSSCVGKQLGNRTNQKTFFRLRSFDALLGPV